jgi:hypothetical protein
VEISLTPIHQMDPVTMLSMEWFLNKTNFLETFFILIIIEVLWTPGAFL